jgi:hypothetical protein
MIFVEGRPRRPDIFTKAVQGTRALEILASASSRKPPTRQARIDGLAAGSRGSLLAPFLARALCLVLVP